MSKEIIDLLEKARNEGVKHTAVGYIDHALTLLKQPKCKTCEDRHKIQNPEYQPPRFLDECETYTTPSSIPCSDCQQPTAGDFTKKARKQIDRTTPRIVYSKLIIELCDRLDRAEATKKDLLEACEELAATFVGLPEGSIGGQAMKKANAAIAKAKQEGERK